MTGRSNRWRPRHGGTAPAGAQPQVGDGLYRLELPAHAQGQGATAGIYAYPSFMMDRYVTAQTQGIAFNTIPGVTAAGYSSYAQLYAAFQQLLPEPTRTLKNMRLNAAGNAVLSDITCDSDAIAALLPQIKAAKLRALAVTTRRRVGILPDVPAVAETVLPGMDAAAWYGILAPAGTQAAIVNQISAEIARILTQNDVKEKLQAQGLDPFYSTPEQFSAIIKSDVAKYAQIIKTANIRMDN